MAKYDGGCTSAYLDTLMAEFFRNGLRYFKETVSDEDYFAPILEMVGVRELEQRIYERFPTDDLVDGNLAWYCEKEGREPRNGRKYGNPTVAFKLGPEETLQRLWNEPGTRRACRALLIEITEAYLASCPPRSEGDALRTRFDELARFFKLSDLESAMLKLAFVRSSTGFGNSPFDGGRRRGALRSQRLMFYAMCIDRSGAEVRALCGEQSALRKYDFVDEDLDINEAVQEFLNGEEKEPLQGRFYRRAEPEEVLPWSFYSKAIRRQGEMLARLIRSRKPGVGVNILLYGEPGTGKTSLAMTLARDLGLDAYEIMHGEADGRNTSLGSRLIGVQVCNEQMPRGTGLMVVDEDGKRLFFERMFATRLSPEDAAALTEVHNLTPGDFRTVRQSLYYLGGGVTNAQRIAALAKESAVKRDTKAPTRIGF